MCSIRRHLRIRRYSQEPILVVDPRHVLQRKAHSSRVVVAIQDLDLLLDHLIRDISSFPRFIGKHDVEVEIEDSFRVRFGRSDSAGLEPLLSGYATLSGNVRCATSGNTSVS